MFEITYIEVCDSAGKLYPIKPTTRDVLDAAKPDWRRAVGRPEWYILDDTSLLLGAVPDTEYVLYIEFLRIPRNPMKALTDVPEIHEAHHDGLIQWALHKAFSKPDSDLFDPARSKEAEAASMLVEVYTKTAPFDFPIDRVLKEIDKQLLAWLRQAYESS